MLEYEHRRNDASAMDYQENIEAARFPQPAQDLLGLRAAVRDQQDQATRLIKAMMGMAGRRPFSIPRTCSG
jgi:hypothetical protein